MTMRDGREAFANKHGVYYKIDNSFPRAEVYIADGQMCKLVSDYNTLKHPVTQDQLIRFSSIAIFLLYKLVEDKELIKLDFKDSSKNKYLSPAAILKNSIMLPIRGDKFGNYIYLPKKYLEDMNACSN